ncbi:M23 family metallopeptidase [Arthrobacter sp. B3I9]|uniref:M23 family metallopeptidase n=1 Tax=Arthrobacter sp. B3I9 TaxID=3042270 RepID=UPI0027D8CA92|nr:M23 family metallopeptidase [Arthrobacter sp. B3I9]
MFTADVNALVSYSRAGVRTASKDGKHEMNVASLGMARPPFGSLMAPLEKLTPTSAFGPRISPLSGAAGEFHWGQDYSAPCGTRVYVADAGVVRAVGWHPWGGGNRVEIDHQNGLITTYNHLQEIAAKKGESVEVGEVIAKVGTTGSSTGCHLHFETIKSGRHVNPLEWTLLPTKQIDKLGNIEMISYAAGANGSKSAPSWAIPVREDNSHAVTGGNAETVVPPPPEPPVYALPDKGQDPGRPQGGPNGAPVSLFTAVVSGLVVDFDGSGSSDDGKVVSYTWDFGDGTAAATGPKVRHTYGTAKTYTVSLKVTDNAGLEGTSSQPVTVTAPPVNRAPVSLFTAVVSGLVVDFDGSGSSDDGKVVSYTWDFGDGTAAATGPKVQHTYGTAKTYTVSLNVTDNAGLEGTSSQPVTATMPPVSLFTAVVSGLVVDFDGSGSSDDGKVVSYTWDFGDGTAAATGPKVRHTYGTAKTYTVSLKVTDNAGLEGTSSQPVTVTAPPVNRAPVSLFTAVVSGLVVDFDGSGSSDDGKVVSYTWDFGDGTAAATGPKVRHTYGTAKKYTVSLKVTDNAGLEGTSSQPVTVPPVNGAPVR